MNKDYAVAKVEGSEKYPEIYGTATFKQTDRGTVVSAEIFNLPKGEGKEKKIFAFHIHEGYSCSGDETDPFKNAGGHYNPAESPHPYHAGGLPPLFGNDGYASMSVLTNRFTVEEVIGRAIIIHLNPDDFSSQPSGAAGEKIACGLIKAE